ncbi:DUF998 domain-containing protein [Palleronia abyssalis]|uniref:DUF998 domain-containing protein n=1 Tax=Palleronia abyssalis TaxID=1501240 RepID=A0A2R8BTK6_9RHOB|nr:DUF998 domain-containing protein [Palleronia abyssalis]SPJ23465.1 hypothetical protein PAA8504_01276 [Palleronia abyssalis]
MFTLEDRHEEAEVVSLERPELLMFCGLMGLAGCIAPFVTIVWGTAVADHDFIADTISDLARGDHKRIMDVGFYLNASGLLAIAIAAAHAHLGKVGWTLGVFALSFLALVVVLLGLWDEFNDVGGPGTDMTVHTQLTFLLGPLYLIGPLVMAKGAGGISPTYGWLFVASAAIWALFAAAFKLSPDSIDGIVEKIAIGGSFLWTVPLSFLFIARGYEKTHRVTGRRQQS